MRIRSSVTDTTSVTLLEVNITVLTPRGTPRVLNGPVVSSVTSSQDTVVEVLLTVIENTRGVELEVGSINTNRDGLLSEGSSELVTVTLGNNREALDLVFTLLGLALTVLSSVGIVSFSSDTVGLDVSESSGH